MFNNLAQYVQGLFSAKENIATITKKEWRCFHCDAIFTSAYDAELHFGRDENVTPACQIVVNQGLLKALREAEDAADKALTALHFETTEAHKAYHALASRYRTAMVEAEQEGYDKGLRDGREEVLNKQEVPN